MVHYLSDYQRGEMKFNLGKTGRMDVMVLRRVLARADGKVFVLPKRRRIGKLGPKKILEFKKGA